MRAAFSSELSGRGRRGSASSGDIPVATQLVSGTVGSSVEGSLGLSHAFLPSHT